MKYTSTVIGMTLCALPAWAALRYVALDGGHVAPYTSWAAAATNVPAALAVAGDGDEIIVSAGVYAVTAPILVTNNVLLGSAAGSAATVLASTATGRVLQVLADVATIRGFTISNGMADRGGGVLCSNNTLVTLADCVLVNNRATGGTGIGGGVYGLRSGMIISNCLVYGNTATYSGGGICVYNGPLSITATAVISNSAAGWGGNGIETYATTGVITRCHVAHNGGGGNWGGGVYAHGMLQLRDCQINSNQCDFSGGGVYLTYTTPHGANEIDGCTLAGNQARGNGGGAVYLYYRGVVRNSVLSHNAAYNGGGVFMDGDATTSGGMVSNCLIHSNRGQDGGGVFMYSRTTMHGCSIISNTSNNSSGGILLWGTNQVVRNCLISGNYAATNASAVYCYYGGTLENTTIAGNRAGAGENVRMQGGGLLLNVIVYDNAGLGLYVTGGATRSSCLSQWLPGQGNTTNPPRFADPAAGDYSLAADSPCRNTGTNQSWMTGARDLAGNPRIIEGIVDMGCYEYVPEPAGLGLLGLVTIYKLQFTIWRRKEK